MSMNIIILLPVLAGFGLLYWAKCIEEEHEYLALAFQFMFLPLTFLAIHLAVVDATITYAADTELVTTLANMSYYLGWLLFIIGIYYSFVAMGKAYNLVLQKKQEKQEAKYND
jgi:hypothetical protein